MSNLDVGPPTGAGWLDKLATYAARTGSSICCGLDIDFPRLPLEITTEHPPADAVLTFVREIVAMTADHVCCYKVQKAYLERVPTLSLAAVVDAVRSVRPDIPVILDCKAGDIGNTMSAYFEAYFTEGGFDAVVLNPYMGPGVWAELRRWPRAGALVLVRTSGEGSDLVQRATLADGREVWNLVFDMLTAERLRGLPLVPVLSALDRDTLRQASQMLPVEVPIFVAGVGAQGGTARGLREVVGPDRLLIINSSRSLVFPFQSDDSEWRGRVQAALAEMLSDTRN